MLISCVILVISATDQDECDANIPSIQLIGGNTDSGQAIVFDQTKNKWYPICFDSIPKKEELGQNICALVGFPKLSSIQSVGLDLADFEKSDECLRLDDGQNSKCFTSIETLSNCFANNIVSTSQIADDTLLHISCQASFTDAFVLPNSLSFSINFLNLFNEAVSGIPGTETNGKFNDLQWLRLNISDIKVAYIYSTDFMEEINVFEDENPSPTAENSTNYYNMLGIDLHSFGEDTLALQPINYDDAEDLTRAIYSEFDGKVRAFQLQTFLKTASRKQRIHALYHWILDSQFRKNNYFQYAIANFIPSHDQIARNLYTRLHQDGIVMFDESGLSVSELDELMNVFSDTILENDVTKFSSTSNGSVVTVRRKNQLLENYLTVGNMSIINAIKAYLGADVLLSGYKITKLSSSMRGSKDYIAGHWHHDRVGRRLKLFIFLNDVDCDEGRPTLVAKGTNLLEYWKSDSLYSSRFRNEYVSDRYNVIRGCGKRGSGFLFDTHTIHRAGVELQSKERNVDRMTVIGEYHNVIKCHLNDQYNLGLPCPSGDQYIVNRVL